MMFRVSILCVEYAYSKLRSLHNFRLELPPVAANRENDTFFKRICDGSSRRHKLSRLVKMLEKSFKHKLGPLPDTL